MSSLNLLGTPSQDNSDTTIVVFGVTGNQGGSAARALLQDGFKVVGVTRSTESESAKGGFTSLYLQYPLIQIRFFISSSLPIHPSRRHPRPPDPPTYQLTPALAALGVTLHQGDLDAPETYAPALEGAYGAFFNQDFFASYRGNGRVAQAAEETQGFAAAQALAAAGLKHVVVSTCESVPDLVIPHFDGKAAVAARFRAAGLPTTLLYTCYYFSNVLAQLQVTDTDTEVVTAAALPDDVVIPSMAVEQIGLFIAAAFKDPNKWVGKDMYPVGEKISVSDIARTLAKVTGRPVKTMGVTHEQFENDKTTDREWYLNFEAFRRGLIKRDVDASRRIVPGAWDFKAWAEQNEKIRELRK